VQGADGAEDGLASEHYRWIGIGVLLIAAPTFGSDSARRWIIAVAAVAYGCSAAGNAMASRGRHFGWMLMSPVVVLSLVGL
jgi:hypothetical protein